jgi:NAD(P)-dependent dehydrogenase (short-subunit alcohol dehydrogenase family)
LYFSAIVISGDLGDLSTVKQLFDETINAFGRVDIVINNAGLVIKKPFVEITEEDFERFFGINAKAAFFVMQEAARRIADNGRIIRPSWGQRPPSTQSTPVRKHHSKTSHVRSPERSAIGVSP